MDYGTKVIMHYAITDSDDIGVIKRRVDSLPLRIGQIPSHLVEARDGKGSGRELGILVADTEDTGLTILLDVWRHIVKRERNTTNLRRLLTATGGARLEVPETGGKSIYNSSGMDLVYDRNGAERRVHIDYFSTFPVLHNGEGA